MVDNKGRTIMRLVFFGVVVVAYAPLGGDAQFRDLLARLARTNFRNLEGSRVSRGYLSNAPLHAGVRPDDSTASGLVRGARPLSSQETSFTAKNKVPDSGTRTESRLSAYAHGFSQKRGNAGPSQESVKAAPRSRGVHDFLRAFRSNRRTPEVPKLPARIQTAVQTSRAYFSPKATPVSPETKIEEDRDATGEFEHEQRSTTSKDNSRGRGASPLPETFGRVLHMRAPVFFGSNGRQALPPPSGQRPFSSKRSRTIFEGPAPIVEVEAGAREGSLKSSFSKTLETLDALIEELGDMTLGDEHRDRRGTTSDDSGEGGHTLASTLSDPAPSAQAGPAAFSKSNSNGTMGLPIPDLGFFYKPPPTTPTELKLVAAVETAAPERNVRSDISRALAALDALIKELLALSRHDDYSGRRGLPTGDSREEGDTPASTPSVPVSFQRETSPERFKDDGDADGGGDAPPYAASELSSRRSSSSLALSDVPKSSTAAAPPALMGLVDKGLTLAPATSGVPTEGDDDSKGDVDHKERTTISGTESGKGATIAASEPFIPAPSRLPRSAAVLRYDNEADATKRTTLELNNDYLSRIFRGALGPDGAFHAKARHPNRQSRTSYGTGAN